MWMGNQERRESLVQEDPEPQRQARGTLNSDLAGAGEDEEIQLELDQGPFCIHSFTHSAKIFLRVKIQTWKT